MLLRSRILASVLFLLILVIAGSTSISIVSASDLDLGRCENSNQYQCPNCGGILVSDCLDCDGYLNTGK